MGDKVAVVYVGKPITGNEWEVHEKNKAQAFISGLLGWGWDLANIHVLIETPEPYPKKYDPSKPDLIDVLDNIKQYYTNPGNGQLEIFDFYITDHAPLFDNEKHFRVKKKDLNELESIWAKNPPVPDTFSLFQAIMDIKGLGANVNVIIGGHGSGNIYFHLIDPSWITIASNQGTCDIGKDQNFPTDVFYFALQMGYNTPNDIRGCYDDERANVIATVASWPLKPEEKQKLYPKIFP